MHAFLAAGCRVVLGDDNPINIGTRLAAEERRLVEEGGLTRGAAPRRSTGPPSRSRSPTTPTRAALRARFSAAG